jgi:uncharacterized membrane protein YgcG
VHKENLVRLMTRTTSAQLGTLRGWRHAAAGAAVIVCSGLALFGVIGDKYPERFDAKHITVTPSGDDGLTIREVVDEDFGSSDRHGYQRIIPNDFGAPTDITAASRDAPADVSVEQVLEGTRIRVGDPNITVSGQHRYVLNYTYPAARLWTGELALNIIGNDETMPTGRLEIVVTGLELDDPQCNVGSFGATGGCTLERYDGAYRAVITSLRPGDGITIGGTITDRANPLAVAEPALPARRGDDRVPMAVAMLVTGTVAAAGVYAIARWRGRNEVSVGGAADAAYGKARAARSRLVADKDMDELATIEFAPPDGLEPWQGTVLLRERIDDESVGTWFSGLAARGVITLARDDHHKVTLGIGDKFDTAAPPDAKVLASLFRGRDKIELGKYDKRFAAAWRKVRWEQERAIACSGWWKRHAPHGHARLNASRWPFFVMFGWWTVALSAGAVWVMLGLVSSPPAALILGFAVPALAAVGVYRKLLPVRSATGSAFTLRAESFRRFLEASEGRHVEWAWKQGLLREYSAWAVALGAADAWKRAMLASNVAPAELSTGPLLVHSVGGSWSSTYTDPSTAGGDSSSGGGSGGGGSSGGSVGGGGGGGSSGSW